MKMTGISKETAYNFEEEIDRIGQKLARKGGVGKQEYSFENGAINFTSRFDSGNMKYVEKVEDHLFHIQVASDAESPFGDSNKTSYTTWFHFQVDHQAEDIQQSREITIVITNMNHQKSLYENGYNVFYRSIDASILPIDQETSQVDDDNKHFFSLNPTQGAGYKWSRLSNPVEYEKYVVPAEPKKYENLSKETKMRLKFKYKFQFLNEKVRFAFCFPYSYDYLQQKLKNMDEIYGKKTYGDIYYHRELLTRSLDGLRVDLVTISSTDGMIKSTREESLPGPFPAANVNASNTSRPFAFNKEKKIVFISARVHPGETPANFILDGMLRLLLHPTDEAALMLRKEFVFKIVPMLNPDGVCRGYYRTDTNGNNLNRVYETPFPHESPTIYAAKQLVLDYNQQNRLAMYWDLHAHANKRGCFVYGNHIPEEIEKQIDTQVFARLFSLNTPYVDYHGCSFSEENMIRKDKRDSGVYDSREGSGRVALYKATGLTYIYTIESNYNSGKRFLLTSRQKSNSNYDSDTRVKRISTTLSSGTGVPSSFGSKATSSSLSIKYTPAEWEDVGIGALMALLDLFQLNTRASAVCDSMYRTLDGLRRSITSDVKAERSFKKVASPTSSGPTSSNNNQRSTTPTPTDNTPPSTPPPSKSEGDIKLKNQVIVTNTKSSPSKTVTMPPIGRPRLASGGGKRVSIVQLRPPRSVSSSSSSTSTGVSSSSTSLSIAILRRTSTATTVFSNSSSKTLCRSSIGLDLGPGL